MLKQTETKIPVPVMYTFFREKPGGRCDRIFHGCENAKSKKTEMTILKAILSVTGVENDITRKIQNCMTAIKTMKRSRLKKKINFKANGRKKIQIP